MNNKEELRKQWLDLEFQLLLTKELNAKEELIRQLDLIKKSYSTFVLEEAKYGKIGGRKK